MRRATQIACFVLFVYLLFAALQRLEPVPYADIFFRFDPLVALVTMLAARAWLPDLALAFLTVSLTIVFGRFWCGWICPLGTLLGWLRFRSARRRAASISPSLRRIKYILLGTIVVLAACANLTLVVLDPISLLTRTATTSVAPGLVYLVNVVATAGMGWEPTVGTVAWMENHLRGSVLPTIQPRHDQAAALFLVLLAVVLLNALADRFWCRYLCPLGALLALLARVQVLRPVVGVACTRCAACARSCRMDAIEVAAPGGPASADAAAPGRVVSSECTMCLDCLVACPQPGALSLAAPLAPQLRAPYDPGRREVVMAAAAALGTAALLGTGVARAVKRPGLIRPPGAQDEARFLSRCLRCSECMKACPTSGLQPSLAEAGLEGLWTPVLRSRLGYCDYACAACGQICPSQAIPELTLAAKRQQVLGLAVIDRNRCLPWATGTPCIVCQEMCPVAPKAIELTRPLHTIDPAGRDTILTRPLMIAGRCIGCGICENKCPVEGPAAIVVLPSNHVLSS